MQPRADDGPLVEDERVWVENGAEAPASSAPAAPPAPARSAPAPSAPAPSAPAPAAPPAPAAETSPGASAHDRWHWRRRVRANPHQHFVYRIGIAILGLMCIAAGALTGPLPGPGGIPLVLLGLAIWASEFRWAHRLMMWCKARLHTVRQLPRGRKVAFWVLFVACCGLLGYSSMVVFGLPGWLPDAVGDVARFLPGVR